MKAHILNTTPCTVPNSIYFSTLPMKKKKRKERKSVFNSQSCLWIVLCTGSPRCKHRFFFFCQITTTTFTYLLLRARFLHVLRLSLCVSCFLETLSMLLLILSRHGNIWGRDSNASKDRKWLACQKKKKPWQQLFKISPNNIDDTQ